MRLHGEVQKEPQLAQSRREMPRRFFHPAANRGGLRRMKIWKIAALSLGGLEPALYMANTSLLSGRPPGKPVVLASRPGAGL
jgi:hypothetical protein